MSIDKITNAPTQNEQINKINEIIDKKLENTATGTSSLTIDGTATSTTGSTNIGSGTQCTANYSIAIGNNAKGQASSSTALGRSTNVTGSYGVALGYGATVSGGKSIQLGYGTNSTANSLSVGFQGGGNYQLLDGTTGKVPSDRIKYDGTTITVNANGELTSAGGGGGGASRNIGEIIQSTIPLSDAGLHLLDGSLLQYGSYQGFIDYIAHIYNRDSSLYQSISPIADVPVLQPVFRGNTEYGITVSDARGNTTVLRDILNGSNATNAVGHWNTYWIQFDYGRPVYLSSYKLQADMVGSQESPTAWSIQGSNDGTTWTTICSETVNAGFWSPGLTGVFNTNSEATYNIFRIVFSAGTEASNNGELKKLTFEAYEKDAKVLFCTEEQWQASVSTYGVCGKFVYDSTNNTVRLPKIKGFTEGTDNKNNVAEITRSGLPNIEGTIAISEWDRVSSSITGAFNNIKKLNSRGEQGDEYGNNHSVSFEASSGATSDGIYGNSNTVQPQSLKVLYYIVIANSTKTEIEVDIDEIATDLNSKADKDLSNLVSTSSTNFDGSPTFKYALLVEGKVTVDTSTNLKSTGYLPNDNYRYEVFVGNLLRSSSAISSSIGNVASPLTNSTAGIICKCRTASNSIYSYNQCWIPLGTDGVIYYQTSGSPGTGITFDILAYRRIGTNT